MGVSDATGGLLLGGAVSEGSAEVSGDTEKNRAMLAPIVAAGGTLGAAKVISAVVASDTTGSLPTGGLSLRAAVSDGSAEIFGASETYGAMPAATQPTVQRLPNGADPPICGPTEAVGAVYIKKKCRVTNYIDDRRNR